GSLDNTCGQIFYSVGTDGSNLATGSPSIDITSGTATLTASQTNDVGVGDMIDYAGGQVFISAVIDASHFRVQTRTGDLPVNTGGDVGLNSITRAFNSISTAVTGSVDGSHLGNGDLIALDKGLTWVCYNDDPFDVSSTTTINGYTTNDQHFITLTVAGASQVATGHSQRHFGVAGTGARMERTGAGAATLLEVDEPYSRIEWLELDGNDVFSTAGIGLTGAADQSLIRNVLVHHLDGAPGNETNTSSGIFIDVGNDSSEVRNSIVYAYDGDGVHVAGANAIVANSTFYLGRTNPSSQSVQTDTGAGVTASVYNVLAVGPETDFGENTLGGLSLYNSISTDSSACDYDVSLSCLTGITANTEFVSLTGPVNLHLRAGARAIDFGTSLASSFNDDVDGYPRPQGAAWDVGADESFASGVTTYYRSIGTRADYGTGQTDGNGTTVTATQGSSSVTCAGLCQWRTFNRGRGDVIEIDGVPYMVAAVTAEDRLTLASLYTGTTSGGKSYRIRRQYATLQGWENCISGAGGCTYFAVVGGDLVADDRSEVGIAYDDATPAFPLGANVTIQGSTTDSSHTILLTADPGNRHNGDPNAGVVIDAQGGGNEFDIRDSNVTVEWLAFVGARGDSISPIQIYGTDTDVPRDVVLQNLLIHDFGDKIAGGNDSSGIDLAGDTSLAPEGMTVTVRNTMIWDGDQYGIEGDGTKDSVVIENVSIDAMTERGTYTSGSTFIVRNCIVTHPLPVPGGYVADYDVSSGSLVGSHNTSTDGTAFSAFSNDPQANTGVDPATIFEAENSDLHLLAGAIAEIDSGLDLSSSFGIDIDGQIRPAGAGWDRGADEFGATTAVELMSFAAVGLDSAVDLSWRTGSELNNLGFHLYRSLSEGGPWTRITSSLIPGLGSSPEGASYSFRDTGLTNGVRYFYRLEDIDAHSGSTFHGPVSAVPEEAPPADEDDDSSDPEDPASEESPHETRTYGHPEATSFEIVSRTRNGVVVELRTPGFLATLAPEGVHVSVPGFDQPTDPRAPDLPLKRVVLDALVGRHARIVWVKERQTRSYPGLTPAAVGSAEIITAPDGTVRPGRRAAAVKGEGLLPPYAAAIAGDAFIGE
ncbi:MAG: hypothetical protein LJF15_14455, partial [Acidobacteria bacterium]|nr:hypothetical protein [Acidobacteriota bacterium]